MDRTLYRRLVRTKVVPPPMADGLIARDRVLARLSPEHRLTLVSAMPGYGKTVVVRHWVDTIDVPVAWLSLDLLDTEPLTFWSHVLYAIGTVCPGADHEAAMLLAERGAGDPLFLSALVADLTTMVDPLVLVLDGLVDQVDPSVLNGLALLVDRAGEVLRMVVTSRSDPSLPLVRWDMEGWLAQLREDELRLTDEEAVALAAAAGTSVREPAEVVALNHRVDGWPIALRMALLARPAGAAGDLLEGSDRLLANYLVGEVLAAMSEQERNVVLALSVVPWFDPDLCRELVGDEGAMVVRRLLGRGMFLSVVDPRAGVMRFHDLFRELMEMELGWRDPPLRVALHRRAAVVWRERGDLLSAYHHLSMIGETGKARDLLVGPALELVDRGDLDALRRFAPQLPIEAEVTHPNLAVDLAVVALYADGTRAARRWMARAEALIGDDVGTDVDAHRAEVSRQLQALRCAIALLEADLDTARAGIDAYRRLADGVAGTSVLEQRLPIVAARVMLAARLVAESDEWISMAERIEEPEILRRVTVPTLRAWHEWWFGSVEVAGELVDDALHWMAEHHIGAHHLAFDTLITGGWCQLAIGNIGEAERLAHRAAADAETLGDTWNRLQAGYLGARVAIVTRDPQRARRIVDDLRAVVPVDTCRPYADRLLGLEVEALAATGNRSEAERVLDTLEPGPYRQLLQVRIQHLPDHDLKRLLAARAGWPAFDRMQAELLICIQQHDAETSEELADVVAACAKAGWVLPFLGLGPRLDRMLDELPLQDLHPQLARTLAYLASGTYEPHEPYRERADVAELPGGVHLTQRELTLVELLPTHLSYAAIGERLFLSVNTVKSNLKAVYRKLDVTTRSEAVEASRRAGLIA